MMMAREQMERRLAVLDGDASMGDFLLSPAEQAERVRLRAALASPPEGADARGVTELEELKLVADENADNVRLLDYISDKIGLPNTEELSRAEFDRWFAKIAASPEGQGREAEPVAWQYRVLEDDTGKWSAWFHCPEAQRYVFSASERFQLRPLYATPTRGLREAATREKAKEILMNHLRKKGGWIKVDYAVAVDVIFDAFPELATPPCQGLVDAAEWHRDKAEALLQPNDGLELPKDAERFIELHRDAERTFRARAATGGAK